MHPLIHNCIYIHFRISCCTCCQNTHPESVLIPAENYSREPGFSLKDEVHEGDEVSATVVRKDDGQGNILLSRVEAVDVLAWDKLKELKESGEVLDVVVKGITNAGVM